VYVDGVYSGRSGASLTAFQDVERVEVLKGPQGTLFGKNSAAGAIHIITKKPGEEFEANITSTLGNYGKQKLEAMVNQPLSDSLFLRVNAMTNERDGFYTNRHTGEAVGNENNGGARVSLLWDASETTSVLFQGEYADVDQDSVRKYGLVNGDDVYGDLSLDGRNSESLELWGGSVTIDSDLGSTLFTSITSAKRFESYNAQDEDGTAIFGLYFDSINAEENNFFSQEFRLVSNDDSDLRWTLGAMYSREHGKQTTGAEFSADLVDRAMFANPEVLGGLDAWNAFVGVPTTYTAATAPAGFGLDIATSQDLNNDGIPDNFFDWGTPAAGGQALLGSMYQEQVQGELKSYSSAIYGDMSYALNHKLDVTFGVRYTQDKKDYALLSLGSSLGFVDSQTLLGAHVPSVQALFDTVEPALARSESWSNTSFRAVLDYSVTEDAMLYLSYATGYKAGGFNSTNISDPFEPEEVSNLELGLKSSWLDGRLRLNGSVFSYEYDGLQEVSLVTSSNGLSNLEVRSIDSKALGAEVDVSWLATQALVLSATYSYLDSEITDYPLLGTETSSDSLVGQPQSSMAKNAYTLGAGYTVELQDLGELVLRMDYSYTGSRINEPVGAGSASALALVAAAENQLTDGYRDVTARVTFRTADGHWRAALYGKNLTDEEYLYKLGGFSTATGSPSAARAAPRLYGMEVGYTF